MSFLNLIIFMPVLKVLETQPGETDQDNSCPGGIKTAEDGVVGQFVGHHRGSNGY